MFGLFLVLVESAQLLDFSGIRLDWMRLQVGYLHIYMCVCIYSRDTGFAYLIYKVKKCITM